MNRLRLLLGWPGPRWVFPALGPLACAAATPALFAGFVVAQHAAPNSVLTAEFATGRSWHTNYWITAAMALLTLALSWRLRGIPWPDRP